MFLFGKERKAAKAATTTARPGGGAQQRQTYRSPVQIPVSYVIPTDRRPHRRIGIARDISAGGMKLMVDRPFEPGTPIELRFTLPNKFLDTFAKEVKETEVSPFGERMRKVQKTVRPFEEIEQKATIVRATPDGIKHALAIKFNEVDRRTEEEIARFNHYWQLYQVRRRKELEDD